MPHEPGDGQELYGGLWWEAVFGKLGTGAKCGGSLKPRFGLSLEPRDPPAPAMYSGSQEGVSAGVEAMSCLSGVGGKKKRRKVKRTLCGQEASFSGAQALSRSFSSP